VAGAGASYVGPESAGYVGTETTEPVGGHPGTEYSATGTGTPVVADEERTVPGQGIRP